MISVSIVSAISEVSSSDWDTCSLDTSGPEEFNPFLTHGFLSSLEESGSAIKVSSLHFNFIPSLGVYESSDAWAF